MAPRPRETSDAEILAAAARVMQRRSPVDLTLADVATEAGVVPATLIQRFGTKRELLLASCKAGTADVAGTFAEARAKYGSPLKTLIALLVECSSFAATPESMANGLAYLQIDLTDPEFHAITLAQFVTMRDQIKLLLDEAVSARELKAGNTFDLARLIQQVYDGAMLDWAVYRKGPLAVWMRRSFEDLLAPYRSVKAARNRTRGGKVSHHD
jgi:AcrR family transcriptional regulator